MPAEWPIPFHSAAFSAARGWEAAADLSAGQHGVVSLAQLRRSGVAPATVRSWVGRRRLVRLYAGVYAVGHAVLRPEGHRLAAVLACGDHAYLSHAAAGANWAIRASSATLIDVTTRHRAGRSRRGVRVHSGASLRDDEVTVENGIPCTTVARTLLDLAGVLQGLPLAAVVETSERLGRFDLREVGILLGRHRGRRGCGRLRHAIEAFDPELIRTRSEPEARFYCLCVDAGLPRPLVNRRVDVGKECFEVDLLWREQRVILEVDSPFHDTTAARIRDRARDAALRAQGWTVLRRRPPTSTRGQALWSPSSAAGSLASP